MKQTKIQTAVCENRQVGEILFKLTKRYVEAVVSLLGVKKRKITNHGLPETPGVHYFFDESDAINDVGKNCDFGKRVPGHFSADLKSGTSPQMKQELSRIDYRLTGNKLIALLLDSEEINRLSTKFKHAHLKPEAT